LVDDKEDSLDVNLKQDVCLGKDAWEHSIKTINLTDPKVVSFATHTLNPGDKAAHYAKATVNTAKGMCARMELGAQARGQGRLGEVGNACIVGGAIEIPVGLCQPLGRIKEKGATPFQATGFEAKGRTSSQKQKGLGTYFPSLPFSSGGAEGNRTPHLLNAIQALSQLSYSPEVALLITRSRQGCQQFYDPFFGVCKHARARHRSTASRVRQGRWNLGVAALAPVVTPSRTTNPR
jgi:hypothetical protein